MVRIKEIFASIQGEGPLVGYKQLFLRFCGCNLHCNYCDTEFDRENSKDYDTNSLLQIVNDNLDCNSVSLTGGEPLLSVDFLKDFLPKCKLPIYLETNATLVENLKEVIDYVDIVAADIKLPSCTNLKPLWEEHDKFFEIASTKNLYAKIVFDNNITEEEIIKSCELCRKYNIELVLQPKMVGIKPTVNPEFMSEILNKCLRIYKKCRLIPQVHKFIDVQ